MTVVVSVTSSRFIRFTFYKFIIREIKICRMEMEIFENAFVQLIYIYIKNYMTI